MRTVADFANITHYRQIGFFDLAQISNITQKVVKLDIKDKDNQKEILDWQQIAFRIDTSLNAQRPFYRMVLDFFTLQFIKKWILHTILPKVMLDINKVGLQIIQEQTKQEAIKVAQANKINAAQSKQEAIKVAQANKINAAQSKQEEIKVAQTNKTRKARRKKTGGPVTGVNASLIKTALAANTYFLSKKSELCKQAVYLKSMGSASFKEWTKEEKDELSLSLEREVSDYFEEKINALEANEEVALPTLYHVTKKSFFTQIIKDGELEPGVGSNFGKGVYFSTLDEHHKGYGPYTFAVDSRAVDSLKADYVVSLDSRGLWVCVEKNVPINKKVVAHIAVSNLEEQKEVLEQLKLSDESMTDCPIITRLASEVIRKAFQNTYTYKIPSCWKKHPKSLKINIPYIDISEAVAS